MGMNYGLKRLANLGVKARQIRVTGGGANSKVWRQIMADIFNAEVVTLSVSEGAAYGAAIQAMWCVGRTQSGKSSIEELTDRFVKINKSQISRPNPENMRVYKEFNSIQDSLSNSLRAVFDSHRGLLVCE